MHAPILRPRSLLALAAVAAALLLAPALAPPATAAPHATPPRELGAYGAWIAATHGAGHDRICYAFTRANGENAVTGHGPVLSVTDRATGRDQVAVSGAPLFRKGARATVMVGRTALDFYTSGHDAFARDGHAAVKAFISGADAELRPPGRHAQVLKFSLTGFTKAYDAVRKTCTRR